MRGSRGGAGVRTTWRSQVAIGFLINTSPDYLWVRIILLLGGVCLFDFILYVPSTSFQFCRDGSSCVVPVLS